MSNSNDSSSAKGAALPGLSDDQRAELRQRLLDLAKGISSATPLAETMAPACACCW
jgi:hypothetical protein